MYDYLNIADGAPNSPAEGWWWRHANTGSALEQPVDLPTPMLRDIEKYAERAGRDPSWCLHMAWWIACQEIAELDAKDRGLPSRLLKGRPRRKLTELPASAWQDVFAQAARLARSTSWLLQQAWLIARPRFMDRPSTARC